MQITETDNLNKNAIDYFQHIIILIKLAVFESQHILENS